VPEEEHGWVMVPMPDIGAQLRKFWLPGQRYHRDIMAYSPQRICINKSNATIVIVDFSRVGLVSGAGDQRRKREVPGK
jgi:hypothetical protein